MCNNEHLERQGKFLQLWYKSNHVEILKRKKEWFKKMPKMHMVLWYVEEGYIPTVEEAKERLDFLREHGESEHALSFKSKY